MKDLFGVPVGESEEAGDCIYLLPQVQAVVYVPPQGFTFEERIAAEQRAIIEAYTQAAKRGEVSIIKNAMSQT